MSRAPLRWLAVFAVTLSPAGVLADDVPAVPIRELPPFPDVEADVDTVSEIGVYGATLADEETVVGASKREQSLGTVASAVTVLTADQIRRFGYRTLSEALRGVAGVYITDDRNIERVGIRGIQPLGDANTRILILIDGTPFNEPWSQFVDASLGLPVSLDDVARIEVIRGPVSSIYGTNAFVGIVNIVTLEADKAPKAYGRTTMDTDGTFGANAAFNTGDINRQVRGTLSYQYRLGETVEYDDLGMAGIGPSTSADAANALFGSVSVNFDQLFFQARAYQRKRELPGAPYGSDFGSTANTDEHRHLVAEVGYTRDVNEKVTLAARLYVNRYDYNNHLSYANDPDFAANEDGKTFLETDASSLWYGGEIRALADVLKKKDLLSLTTGAALEFTSTESDANTADPVMAGDPTAIENDFNIAGVYLEATTAPVKWFALTAGARYDRNSEFETKVSPRAAAFVRKGEDYGLKLLYAEGFRNPSIFEAYYDDGRRFKPGLDDNGTLANPDDDFTTLRPETIRAYEFVAYGKLATGIKGRLSVWDWTLKDVLTRDLILDPDLNERRLRYQNTAEVISRGVELESSYRDVEGRFAYASVSVAKTAANCLGDTGFGNPLLDIALDKGNCEHQENAPELLAKLGGSSQLLMKLFYVSAELFYVGTRYNQNLDNDQVKAFVGANLAVYFPNVRGFDITVGGRNLAGRETVPAQSDYNRTSPSNIDVITIPGPGPEVFARVGYRF
jgi:outer membrane receptor for ferrienterochelin and colicins